MHGPRVGKAAGLHHTYAAALQQAQLASQRTAVVQHTPARECAGVLQHAQPASQRTGVDLADDKAVARLKGQPRAQLAHKGEGQAVAEVQLATSGGTGGERDDGWGGRHQAASAAGACAQGLVHGCLRRRAVNGGSPGPTPRQTAAERDQTTTAALSQTLGLPARHGLRAAWQAVPKLFLPAGQAKPLSTSPRGRHNSC